MFPKLYSMVLDLSICQTVYLSVCPSHFRFVFCICLHVVLIYCCSPSPFPGLLDEQQKSLLCTTLSELLESACQNPSHTFSLAVWSRGKSTDEQGDVPTDIADGQPDATQTENSDSVPANRPQPEAVPSQSSEQQLPCEQCLLACVHRSTHTHTQRLIFTLK